jgi:acid phosphatase (class A)
VIAFAWLALAAILPLPCARAETKPEEDGKPADVTPAAGAPAVVVPKLSRPPGLNFSFLPPPPADDSPAGLADLNVLLYVQSVRTPEMTAMAKDMASPSVFRMNRPIFGEWFTRENLPKTAAILREASKVTSPILSEAKAHWKRPRPFVRSEKIQPVVSKPGDAGSYPSGHSFGIAVPEFILTEAFPQHAEALDANVRKVMWGRIVGGVHFPSDTEAGRLIGKETVKELMKTPAMRECIDIIRKEAAPFMTSASPTGTATPAPVVPPGDKKP